MRITKRGRILSMKQYDKDLNFDGEKSNYSFHGKKWDIFFFIKERWRILSMKVTQKIFSMKECTKNFFTMRNIMKWLKCKHDSVYI